MPSDWKYEHEKHNRQEKAGKVDYREDLRSETLDRSTPEHIEQFSRELDFKQSLIDRFRIGTFFRGPYHLCLDWTLERFANANRLGFSDVATEQIFRGLHNAAARDLPAIINAIRAARVSYQYDNNGDLEPSITIKARLNCEQVLPARRRPSRLL